MRSEAESKARYQQGTANGGAVWNARKGAMAARWAASVGAGPIRSANYQRGLAAAQYRAGDPNYWWSRWREAMSM